MRYLCFDSKSEFDFLTAGRFVAVEDYVHQKRCLKDAVLLLGFSGECHIAQDGIETVIKKGDFRILFPNTTHYGTKPNKSSQSHFWCHFYLPENYIIADKTLAETYRQNGYVVIPEYASIRDFSKFFVLFSQLIDSAENDVFNLAICNSYLKILLCMLADNDYAQKNEKAKKVIFKLKEWMEFEKFKNTSVSAAAKALGYNANYLSRVVKEEVGLTPIEFINQTRVKKAKNMLVNSNMKLSGIAYECGFTDEKYFLKVFKKYENITPSQYRNAFFRKNVNKF